MSTTLSRPTPGDDPGQGLRDDALAVVIGIGRYSDPRIPKLDYAVADAEAFCRVLVDPERGRFHPDNVKLLPESEATLIGIRRAIGIWLREQVAKNPGAMAVIFFCGHGECEADPLRRETDGYAKYLLPVDADARELWLTALSSASFTELLTAVNAKRLVILLDACFAGAVVEAGGAKARGDLPAALDISDDIQKRLQAQAGTVIISAARSNQRSYEHESLGHGIFTHHLIEALSAKADFDRDGYIGVGDVYRYLDTTVPLTAERLCKEVQKPVMNHPPDEAPDIILAVDVSRLKEIKRERRVAELDRLFKTDILTKEEFVEALAILDLDPTKAGSCDPVVEEHLLRVLDKTGSIDGYRAIRQEARNRVVVQQLPLAPVQQPPAPGPTSVGADVTPEPANPSWFVSLKRLPWGKIGPVAFSVGVAGAIGITLLYSALFSPRIDVIARDVDWEPRNPKVGQLVTFTGKFSTTYRVRQGYRWEVDEIAGKGLADTFTATWSVDGRHTDIEDPRKIKTGEIVDTRFETTFQKPGAYTISFAIKARLHDADETNNKLTRTILVQASD